MNRNYIITVIFFMKPVFDQIDKKLYINKYELLISISSKYVDNKIVRSA